MCLCMSLSLSLGHARLLSVLLQLVMFFANRMVCLYAVRGVVFNPKMDVSRGVQTIAYTIVNGSYVQKAPTELQDKVRCFSCINILSM